MLGVSTRQGRVRIIKTGLGYGDEFGMPSNHSPELDSTVGLHLPFLPTSGHAEPPALLLCLPGSPVRTNHCVTHASNDNS